LKAQKAQKKRIQMEMKVTKTAVAPALKEVEHVIADNLEEGELEQDD